MGKTSTKGVSKLKKELDKWFSLFIRYRDKGVCYTCGMQKHPKEMQNGHFAPRQYLAVRYSEINNNCQCYACNMLYNGQPSAYAINLKKQYGEGIVEEIESLRKQTTKLTPMWYEEQIELYKKRAQELIERF